MNIVSTRNISPPQQLVAFSILYEICRKSDESRKIILPFLLFWVEHGSDFSFSMQFLRIILSISTQFIPLNVSIHSTLINAKSSLENWFAPILQSLFHSSVTDLKGKLSTIQRLQIQIPTTQQLLSSYFSQYPFLLTVHQIKLPCAYENDSQEQSKTIYCRPTATVNYDDDEFKSSRLKSGDLVSLSSAATTEDSVHTLSLNPKREPNPRLNPFVFCIEDKDMTLNDIEVSRLHTTLNQRGEDYYKVL